MRLSWLLLVLSVLLIGSGCGGNGGSPSAGDGNAPLPDTTGGNYDDIVLAEVGGTVITLGDIRTHMLKSTAPDNVEAYLKNPDILQIALDSMVDQFVWAEQAMREDFSLNAAEKRQIKMLESELLANRYVGDVIQGSAQPERWEVEEWYKENQERFMAPARVAVRHILVETQAQATDLMEQVRGGENFAALARKHTKDNLSRDLGGALGYIQKDADIPGLGKNNVFEKKVLAMDPGDVDFVQSSYGWHVVTVEKKDGGNLQSLDEVYDAIAGELAKRKFGSVYNQALAEARDYAGVRYDSRGYEIVTGIANNPERLMAIAAEQVEPGARVELYRKVVFNSADHPRAAEAQFRIGYIRLIHSKNRPLARKALSRLAMRYPHSDWAKAGELLLKRIDGDVSEIESPEELLEMARSGN